MTSRTQLDQTVLSWPGVTASAHQLGGTEYRLGKRRIGCGQGGPGLLDPPGRTTRFVARIREIHEHLCYNPRIRG